ncbi:MAG: hypothetical protein V5A46_08750 [Haloferacaceae archaeon]
MTDRNATVTIRGERTVRLADTPAVREEYGWESRRFTIRCHTGRVVTGRWGGVPLGPAIEAANFPDDTTHLLATGGDGHRACVEVEPALGGLVGFVCEEIDRGHDEEPDEEFEDDWQDTPRLLAPGIDSARTVRDVVAIAALSLSAEEDPEAYEAIT